LAVQDKPSEAEAALLERAQRHLLGNYRPHPVVMAYGKGSELFDCEGRRYLDFCAGVAVCCLGHAHPALASTIAEQAASVLHVSNYFYNLENIELAAELCAATGFDRAFFCNSGAEANEAALKLVRRVFWERGDKERVRVIAFDGAFHGRTLGALALTGTPAYRDGFGPLLGGVDHVPYGDIAAVRARLGSDLAAIFVEPIMGESGVLLPPPSFLAELRQACDDAGALLVFDEVQVGMGRTGRFLGSDHSGVRADAITLAKGLAGGVPIGALLLREALAGGLPPGSHGSTFGGNPLASAAARCVLRVLHEEGLVEKAVAKGERLGAGLARVAARHDALCSGERGLGLLRAITLTGDRPSRDLLPYFTEVGLLVTAAGSGAVRFSPPLVVTDTEIDEAIDKADAALARAASHPGTGHQAGHPKAGHPKVGHPEVGA
jgi:acetylornithine/N-succinyldiaminopimelate aminotransferase